MMQLQAVRVYCGDAGPLYDIILEAREGEGAGGGGRAEGQEHDSVTSCHASHLRARQQSTFHMHAGASVMLDVASCSTLCTFIAALLPYSFSSSHEPPGGCVLLASMTSCVLCNSE